MNNIISTIRYGAVLGVALFAFAGNVVFAAPAITPAQVSLDGSSGVSISAKAGIPNEWGNVDVWFQYGTTPEPGTVVGMRHVFSRGGTMEGFSAKVSGLDTGTTYYFRAVAMQGGSTVYSPVTSYTIAGPKPATSNVVVMPGSTTATTTTTQTTTQSSPEVVVINRTVNVSPTTKTVTTSTKKVASATPVKKVEPENTQGASVLDSMNGALPQTALEWLLLFVLVFFIMLMLRKITDSFEDRRLAREYALAGNRGDEHKAHHG